MTNEFEVSLETHCSHSPDLSPAICKYPLMSYLTVTFEIIKQMILFMKFCFLIADEVLRLLVLLGF